MANRIRGDRPMSNRIRAAEAWRQWLTGSPVRMQDLDDTEQALIDALAQARCGQCRQCDECRRDAPFAVTTPERPRQANQEGPTAMATVTITIEADRDSKTTQTDDDEAVALARCLYRLAGVSPYARVAQIADAVYRVMHVDPEETS